MTARACFAVSVRGLVGEGGEIAEEEEEEEVEGKKEEEASLLRRRPSAVELKKEPEVRLSDCRCGIV